MKSVLIAFALFVGSFCTFAQATVDRTKVETELKTALTTVKTWDELKDAVSKVYTKYNIKPAVINRRIAAAGVYGFNHKFTKEAYTFAKTNNIKHYTFYAVFYYRNMLGITDAEAVKVLTEGAQLRSVPAARKSLAVDKIFELAPKVDAKLIKESLTTLNRAFTPYLLGTEKGQYESVVAKIRTMLAAY